MNTINSIGSQIFRGSVSTNSASYINKQKANVSFDPSGTDYIDYSNNNNYFHDAHGINPNNENTTSLILNQSSIPFSLSSLDEFTIYMKYKVHDIFNLPILGQIYTNPNYELILSNPSPNIGETFTVTVLNASNTNVTYTISGNITSADLNNADMSGILTDLENKLTYTLNSGSGQFLFLLDNTDISASFVITMITTMDFGTLNIPTSGYNGTLNHNTTLNHFLDSYDFSYNYTEVNYDGENQVIEGVNTANFSPSTDSFTKAINYFYGYSPHGFLQKTVNGSGTFSVWYGIADWNTTNNSIPCRILKNGGQVDRIEPSDTDNRRRRVDIQVESGDVIRIEEGWGIMLLYAVIFPGT